MTKQEKRQLLRKLNTPVGIEKWYLLSLVSMFIIGCVLFYFFGTMEIGMGVFIGSIVSYFAIRIEGRLSNCLNDMIVDTTETTSTYMDIYLKQCKDLFG